MTAITPTGRAATIQVSGTQATVGVNVAPIRRKPGLRSTWSSFAAQPSHRK